MNRFAELLETIKFEHTIFALPFALLAFFLAADAAVPPSVFGWILVAMVGARSTAMMMNRIADRDVDARNPRTRDRALPRGRLRLRDAWLFTLAGAGLLVLAAWRLNPLALRLSPVALGVIWSYSWTKRFTWASHVWLGVALGLAPLGAWIAVRGTLDLVPVLVAVGVVLWVAGFDTIYACQDAAFDRREGLHSLPARFGVRRALWMARGLHAGMLGVFTILGLVADLGWIYGLGVVLVAGLVVVQHRLVDAENLAHIDVAFFNVNSIVGVLLLLFTLADRAVQG